MEKFCKIFKSNILNRKKMLPLSPEEFGSYLKSKFCCIYDVEFHHHNRKLRKVKDHYCHFTKKHERAWHKLFL